jgi:hypothetical protein
MRFFRNGREITEQEARDEQGLLRDGCSARIAMTDSRRRLVDGDGNDGHALRRPEFRQLRGDDFSDHLIRDTKREAYLDYERRMSGMWRNADTPTAEEEDGFVPEPGTTAMSHHARRNENENKDCRTVDQMMRDHKTHMDKLYQQYEQEQSQAWRGNK